MKRTTTSDRTYSSLLTLCLFSISATAFAVEPGNPTIKELLANGEVMRSVVKPVEPRAATANEVKRNNANVNAQALVAKLEKASREIEPRKFDATAIHTFRAAERKSGASRYGKGGTATYTDFVLPLEWFSPISAYPDYTAPLFTEYRNGSGRITGLGMYSDGNYQFGYWGSDFLELADSISGVAGNADLELIVEVEGYDQIGSTFNNIKYYPSMRTRLNVYGFSNAALHPAGPSNLAASKDLALPYDGEVMLKRDLQNAHAYNDCYVNFGGSSIYADDIYTMSFDFLDFDPNSDKYVEYILRSVTIRAYWYN
ncbi:hypothetical protein IT570_08645 [Candidatus Sumerlaeota bacterium]|nr:hypothetical protein [Candidatus Sumerlaeota bacterium]